MPPSRWALTLEAKLFRALAVMGMRKHSSAPPTPPSPSKVISIPTRTKGVLVELYFYFPTSYLKTQDANAESENQDKKYPVVINFHGGGFTIGNATDDARWCRAVNQYADAVIVSVEYRLAPEFPFPTAVQDGVDATLYIMNHAGEFRLDPHRIALSGFSAGGNLAFSVPLMLHEELKSSAAAAPGMIVSIAAWYPSLDYTLTRAQRRATNIRSDKNIPQFFYRLFDASYLFNASSPSKPIDLASPFLSPSIAPIEMIRSGLPEHIIIYVCEWDMLKDETEKFKDRLERECEGESKKHVVWKVIKEVAHGFDKQPKWDEGTDGLYKEVCAELKAVFDSEGSIGASRAET